MATKKRKSNKFGISPSVIFLNLTVVMLIAIVCFFTYSVINGDIETTSSVVPLFTPVTEKSESSDKPESEVNSSVDSEVSVDTSSDAISQTTSKTPEESDVTSEESSVTSEVTDIPQSSGPAQDDVPSSSFHEAYFDTSLFIGDSISTGLSLYGFLDDDNVFATQGLAPSTAITAEIGGKTLSGKIASFKPEKIFVMLGTNSVGYADADYLVESMSELISYIADLCKSEIYVLSIPPVTAAAEARADNYLTLDAITAYNTKLKSVVENSDATFLDFNAILSDDSGYFAQDYAENDGIHFMGATYQIMLSFLENQTS